MKLPSRPKNLHSFQVIIILIFIFYSCSDNFPSETIKIDEDYYLKTTERGYAFTSTVIDLQFYKRKSFWSDKSIGHIFLYWELGIDSLKVQQNDSSKFYEIFIAKNQKTLLDTSISFNTAFEFDVKPKK
jgi:hypothetical protein